MVVLCLSSGVSGAMILTLDQERNKMYHLDFIWPIFSYTQSINDSSGSSSAAFASLKPKYLMYILEVHNLKVVPILYDWGRAQSAIAGSLRSLLFAWVFFLLLSCIFYHYYVNISCGVSSLSSYSTLCDFYNVD